MLYKGPIETHICGKCGEVVRKEFHSETPHARAKYVMWCCKAECPDYKYQWQMPLEAEMEAKPVVVGSKEPEVSKEPASVPVSGLKMEVKSVLPRTNKRN